MTFINNKENLDNESFLAKIRKEHPGIGFAEYFDKDAKRIKYVLLFD